MRTAIQRGGVTPRARPRVRRSTREFTVALIACTRQTGAGAMPMLARRSAREAPWAS